MPNVVQLLFVRSTKQLSLYSNVNDFYSPGQLLLKRVSWLCFQWLLQVIDAFRGSTKIKKYLETLELLSHHEASLSLNLF
jgi:hypothetical protein